MTEQELYLLTNPGKWPHEGLLPVKRCSGNIVWNQEDAGIVMEDNLCRVWTGNYLGDCDPKEGTPLDYPSPDALLDEWEID
jgi:hypothetical protein